MDTTTLLIIGIAGTALIAIVGVFLLFAGQKPSTAASALWPAQFYFPDRSRSANDEAAPTGEFVIPTAAFEGIVTGKRAILPPAPPVPHTSSTPPADSSAKPTAEIPIPAGPSHDPGSKPTAELQIPRMDETAMRPAMVTPSSSDKPTAELQIPRNPIVDQDERPTNPKKPKK